MNNAIARPIAALASGIVFGLGLAVSQMTDPNKVLSFLNLAGNWDASLLLVLLSALVVSTLGFRVTPGSSPPFDTRYHSPTKDSIDRNLILGAAIFGIGWGLGGFCPGPALAALGSGAVNVLVFVVALVIGGQIGSRILK